MRWRAVVLTCRRRSVLPLIEFLCRRSQCSPSTARSGRSTSSWLAADRQERKRGPSSWGISQASRRVDTDEKLEERVDIHPRANRYGGHRGAICRGARTLCRRGGSGNDRLRVLPVWELEFGNMVQGAWPIATEKVKHDPDYQERRRIRHGPAGRSRAGSARPYLNDRPSGSFSGRWVSTDMLASIFVYRRTAAPDIFSRRIPIPRSPRARNFPRRRCTMGSNTATSCSV